MALDEAGLAYSWGWNAYGQLGLKSTMNRRLPKRIDTGGQRVASVAAGWAHSLAITQRNGMLGWGWGQYGQVGLGQPDRGESTNTLTPRLLPALDGEPSRAVCGVVSCVDADDSQLLHIACGKEFSVALVRSSRKQPSSQVACPSHVAQCMRESREYEFASLTREAQLMEKRLLQSNKAAERAKVAPSVPHLGPQLLFQADLKQTKLEMGQKGAHLRLIAAEIEVSAFW